MAHNVAKKPAESDMVQNAQFKCKKLYKMHTCNECHRDENVSQNFQQNFSAKSGDMRKIYGEKARATEGLLTTLQCRCSVLGFAQFPSDYHLRLLHLTFLLCKLTMKLLFSLLRLRLTNIGH